MELQGDEGRDKLREAAGRSTYPVIRGCPNGVTRMPQGMHPDRRRRQPAGAALCEVNHLSSTGREINRDSLSSGERNGRSPNRASGVVGPHMGVF